MQGSVLNILHTSDIPEKIIASIADDPAIPYVSKDQEEGARNPQKYIIQINGIKRW